MFVGCAQNLSGFHHVATATFVARRLYLPPRGGPAGVRVFLGAVLGFPVAVLGDTSSPTSEILGRNYVWCKDKLLWGHSGMGSGMGNG